MRKMMSKWKIVKNFFKKIWQKSMQPYLCTPNKKGSLAQLV
jgi:hypothetical protein